MYRLNAISLVVGLGVSFGLFLVGNFQIPRNKTKPHQDETPTPEDRFIQYIHWIGALFAFFGGLAWMCMHTFISIVLCKDPNKGIWRKKLAVIRFAITLALFCILMAGVAIGVLFRQSHEIKWPPQLIWKKYEIGNLCFPKIKIPKKTYIFSSTELTSVTTDCWWKKRPTITFELEIKSTQPLGR